MKRYLIACVGAVVLTVFLPQRADAAFIQCADSSDPSCVLIAEFAWSIELFETFSLKNSSPEDFTDASVLFDDGAGGTETGLFDIDPIGAGQTGETFPFLVFPVAVATLTFTFDGTVFTAELAANQLVGDGSTSFASTAVFAQQVTEPASLLLFSAAAAAVVLRRRRLHVPHR